MKSLRKPAAVIIGAAVAFSSAVMGSTVASAATPSEGGRPEGKHCRTVLAKLEPGQTVSRVVSRTCSDQPTDLRKSADTLLMILYSDADWRGGSSVFESSDGPCDFFGYGWGRVGFQTTSFKVYNNCNKIRAYTEANFLGHEEVYYGNIPNVGPVMNDNIRSIRLSGPA